MQEILVLFLGQEDPLEKGEMLLGTLDATPKVPQYTGLTPRDHPPTSRPRRRFWSPPLNLAPRGPSGKARRIPGKEEGGFLPAPILAGGASALQLSPHPAPSLRQPLTRPGSDVGSKNSDAQVPPAGLQGAHPPSQLVPCLLSSCPLVSGNVGGL